MYFFLATDWRILQYLWHFPLEPWLTTFEFFLQPIEKFRDLFIRLTEKLKNWMFFSQSTGEFHDFFLRLINEFHDLFSRNCVKNVTRFSFYPLAKSLVFFCDIDKFSISLTTTNYLISWFFFLQRLASFAVFSVNTAAILFNECLLNFILFSHNRLNNFIIFFHIWLMNFTIFFNEQWQNFSIFLWLTDESCAFSDDWIMNFNEDMKCSAEKSINPWRTSHF